MSERQSPKSMCICNFVALMLHVCSHRIIACTHLVSHECGTSCRAYLHKRALYLRKPALYLRKRALYLRKRALYLRKTAVHLCKRAPHLHAQHVRNMTCLLFFFFLFFFAVSLCLMRGFCASVNQRRGKWLWMSCQVHTDTDANIHRHVCIFTWVHTQRFPCIQQ